MAMIDPKRRRVYTIRRCSTDGVGYVILQRRHDKDAQGRSRSYTCDILNHNAHSFRKATVVSKRRLLFHKPADNVLLFMYVV